MSEEVKEKSVDTLPGTTAEAGGTSTYMKPGPHIVKIINLFSTLKGKQIKADDGSLGLDIHFQNKDGQSISKIFYYSPKPDEFKCKSEFLLARLKIALKLDAKKASSLNEFKGRKIWIAVGAQHNIDAKTGKQIFKGEYPVSYSEVLSDFLPYEEGKPCPFHMFEEDGKTLLPAYKRTYARSMKEGESLEPVKKVSASQSHAANEADDDIPETTKENAIDAGGW